MSEDRAREGIEHLQAAAIEVIAAVRAFLDVAEAVVRDPAAAANAAGALVDVARSTTGTASSDPADPAAPTSEPRVSRIRVS